MDKLRNSLGHDLFWSLATHGTILLRYLAAAWLLYLIACVFPMQLIEAVTGSATMPTRPLVAWFVLTMTCLILVFMLVPTKGRVS